MNTWKWSFFCNTIISNHTKFTSMNGEKHNFIHIESGIFSLRKCFRYLRTISIKMKWKCSSNEFVCILLCARESNGFTYRWCYHHLISHMRWGILLRIGRQQLILVGVLAHIVIGGRMGFHWTHFLLASFWTSRIHFVWIRYWQLHILWRKR